MIILRFCNAPRLSCALAVPAIIASLGLLDPSKAGVELVEESTVTEEGLYFWYPDGEKAYHYAPSISPRGDCFTVANDYIFFGWYKGGMSRRDLMISRKKIGSGQWTTVQLPHKNTLIGPKSRWGESHNTITVGVSTKDGTIHIFYDHHNDPLKYIVSKKGTAFVPDREFTSSIFEPTRGYLAQGQPVRITYPSVIANDQGDLILNYRKGSAIGGNEMVHVYNGEDWTRATQVTLGSNASVPESRKNYAYSPSPVFADGSIYYTFSVRWRRNKSKDVLNEGVYLAQCGPTMTDPWVDLKGRKHPLPIEDYSPFLVADPESYQGKGQNGGPQIAVSAQGDVVLGYRGRGRNSEFDYTYTRKAGERSFKETKGPIKMGIFWGERMWSAKPSRDGSITVRSIRAGDSDWQTELVHNTSITFGSSVSRLVDGKFVVIAEDRSNTKTDRQRIHCYAFDLGTGTTRPTANSPNRVTRTLMSREGITVEAELIAIRLGHLICIVDGTRMEIPISGLSQEDVDFLKKWYRGG